MEVKGYSLAILGDSGVGKTSFSNRYTQNMFNSSERSTIGAEYFQKIFYYYNQSIKLDIYGTSGNENKNITFITSQFYNSLNAEIIPQFQNIYIKMQEV